MAQTQEVRGTATSIRTEDGMTHIRYHATDVVSFNSHRIILRDGGYHTNTTKTRMMQASNQFGLDFSVYQKDYCWFVAFNGEIIDFVDGMELIRIV